MITFSIQLIHLTVLDTDTLRRMFQTRRQDIQIFFNVEEGMLEKFYTQANNLILQKEKCKLEIYLTA